MHGFKGFVEVVTKIKDKLTKKNIIFSEDSWAVDTNYKGLHIMKQIEGKIIGVIGRINPAVINIMKVFGMEHLSKYCTDVHSIGDLCSIYWSSSKGHTNVKSNSSHTTKSPTVDTKEIITRISNLALEFNSGNGTKIQSIEDSIDCKEIVVNNLSKEKKRGFNLIVKFSTTSSL